MLHPRDPVGVKIARPRPWQFALKHGFDRIVAAFVLLLALPVLAAAAVAIWLSLGRPIFFRQVRIGRDGRPFEMLKFRSMRPLEPVTTSFKVRTIRPVSRAARSPVTVLVRGVKAWALIFKAWRAGQ